MMEATCSAGLTFLWMGLPAALAQVPTKATRRVYRRPSLSLPGFDALQIAMGCMLARAVLCIAPFPCLCC